MGNRDWKERLASVFEDLRIIENSKEETVRDFEQFCEFIAEPAFETLAEELKHYGIRSRLRKSREKEIEFEMSFPHSRKAKFRYILILPQNSLELRLRLRLRARKKKGDAFEESEIPFMENLRPSEILKLSKEDIINDFIEKYRDINFKFFTKLD